MADASGTLLVRAGAIDPQGLAAATALKRSEGGTVGEALVRLGLLSEERLVAVFEKSLMVPRASAASLQGAPLEVVMTIPAAMAQAHGVLPVDLDAEGNLTLAMADPTDNHAVDEVAAHTGRFVMRSVAAPSLLREAIHQHYKLGPAQAATRESGTRMKARSGRNTLPPSSTAVPEVAVPTVPAPGPTLSALVRAVSGSPGAPASGAAAPPPQESDTQKSSKKLKSAAPRTSKAPQKSRPQGASAGKPAAEPILLDHPKHTPQPAGTTMPGLGSTPEVSASDRAAPSIDQSLLAPVARLRDAASRDEIIAVLLDYASLLAARVGLFVVQKGQLVCLDGRGPDHVVVAMKWFTIPVDTPSPFRDVLQSKVPYLGRLEDSAESRAFRNALGSSSADLLLLPLMVGDKAVGVLYADQIRTDLRKLSQELLTLSREAGAAFVRIILSHKRRPTSQ